MGSQLFLLSSTSNTLRRSCLDRFFPSTPPKLQHESLESPNYSCSVSYPCRYAFKKLFLVCHLSCINVERRCVFVVTLSSPPDNILFTQICIFLPPASGCPTVPHFLFQHRNCRGKYQTSSAGKDMKPLKSIAIFALCLKSSLSYLHKMKDFFIRTECLLACVPFWFSLPTHPLLQSSVSACFLPRGSTAHRRVVQQSEFVLRLKDIS